jgi:hypothetical protein
MFSVKDLFKERVAGCVLLVCAAIGSSVFDAVGEENIGTKLVGVAYSTMNKNWDRCWGTPAFGRYSAADPEVLTYHAQILADAGVDFIFPDWANNTPHHPLTLNYVFRTGEAFQHESEHPWMF